MEMNIAEINFAWVFTASLISDVLGNLCGISHFYHDADAREDRSIVVILTCCPGGSERHAQFRPRKLLTRTRRGQRFEPTRLPSFIEMSGLRLPSPYSRRYVQDEREVGALDTLPDPRMPNEDL